MGAISYDRPAKYVSFTARVVFKKKNQKTDSGGKNENMRYNVSADIVDESFWNNKLLTATCTDTEYAVIGSWRYMDSLSSIALSPVLR